MTMQTAVLIETLVALGAQVRWASCNIFSTQDHAAAAVVVGPDGTPRPGGRAGVRVEGRDAARSTGGAPSRRCLAATGGGPNMILDDGGDATLLVHKGAEFERAGAVPGRRRRDDSEEYAVILDAAAPLARARTRSGGPGSRPASRASPRRPPPACTGSTRCSSAGTLLFPAINVNDSVTKSKFDNKYGCRHSLIDGINRATDVLIGGKVAVVCGYGDVGKGCAESLRGQGARVIVTEVDPICALQAAMDGYQVATMDDVVETADIFITATGCFDVITAEHMARMKHQAIVGNIGHFDNEIDMAGLAKRPGVERVNIKPQVDEWVFARRPLDHRAVRGPAAEPGQRHRATRVRDVQQLHQPDASPRSSCSRRPTQYPLGVYMLPKHLDEKVARLHLAALGVRAHRADQGAGRPTSASRSRARTSRTTTATERCQRDRAPGTLPPGCARRRMLGAIRIVGDGSRGSWVPVSGCRGRCGQRGGRNRRPLRGRRG